MVLRKSVNAHASPAKRRSSIFCSWNRGRKLRCYENQVNGPAATDTTTEGDTPQAIPATVDPLAAFPKHRGRKSKAELEAIAAAKAAAIKMQQEGMKAADNTAELPTENTDHTDNAESPTEQAAVSEEEAMATALASNEQPTEKLLYLTTRRQRFLRRSLLPTVRAMTTVS